jgi:hypothetical protein
LLTLLHSNVAVTAVSSRSDVGANVGDTRGVLDVLGGYGDVSRDIDGVGVVDDERLDQRIGGDDGESGVDGGVDSGVELDALGVGELVDVRSELAGSALQDVGFGGDLLNIWLA